MGILAQKVKAKYPQYAQVPDDQLEAKVVAKYPQYANISKPKRTMSDFLSLDFLSNVAKSTGSLLGDTVSGIANVFNPNMEQNTLANLGKLGFDTAKLVAGDTAETNRARQLGAYYKQRYGKDLLQTLYEDPAGVAGDLSVLLGGTGAIAKAGKLGKLGGQLSRAGAMVDPLQMAGRGVGAGVRRVMPKRAQIADKMRSTGDDLVTKGLGNPAKQADLYRKGQTSAADIFDRYDLYDRDPSTARMAKQTAMQHYDNIALDNKNMVSIAPTIKKIDAEINRLSTGENVYSDANRALVDELMRRRQQVLEIAYNPRTPEEVVMKRLEGLGATGNYTPLVGVDELTRYRRAVDGDIPKSQFALDAKGSGTAQGAKKMRDVLRQTINSTDPQLERLGLDYGVLKGLEDVFTKAESRASNRQMLNFSKLGGAGLGAFMGGVPGMIGGFALEQVANSPKVLKAGSKGLQAGANTLERAKTPKLPDNVFRTMRVGYNTGRADRAFNQPVQSTQSAKTLQVPDVAPPVQAPPPQKKNISSQGSSYGKKFTVNVPKANPSRGVAFGNKVNLRRSNAY